MLLMLMNEIRLEYNRYRWLWFLKMSTPPLSQTNYQNTGKAKSASKPIDILISSQYDSRSLNCQSKHHLCDWRFHSKIDKDIG